MLQKIKFLLKVARVYDELVAAEVANYGGSNLQYVTVTDRYGVPRVAFLMAVQRSAFRVSLFVADYFGKDNERGRSC